MIYVQVFQPANVPLVPSLDGKGVGTGDLDLFVSTFDSRPDYATSTQISQTGQSSEALEVAASPSGRTIFIGVLAFSGGGQFSLNAMAQAPNDRHSLTVCPVNFTPTAAERGTSTTMLKRASAMMLGLSENRTRKLTPVGDSPTVAYVVDAGRRALALRTETERMSPSSSRTRPGVQECSTTTSLNCVTGVMSV
ncbi:MAG: hypothetical protein ABIR79_10680 [Candidatus Binatia bacterium]